MKVMRQLNRIAVGSTVVAAAAFASVGIAQADGMPGRAKVVYEQPSNWSGFYFGIHSGWQWSDINSEFVTAAGASLGVNDSVQHDSQVVGGQIGLQHQWGNIVLGVEGGLTVAYQNSWGSVDCPNVLRTCAKRFDDVLTIGPRIGWAMGKYMPYLSGGYANARFEHESHDKAALNPVFIGGERLGGWYIGGGVDMALSHGWTLGLEYRHYDFGATSFLTFQASPAAGAGTFTGDFRNLDATVDTVAVRVSWKFGRPERVEPLK